MSSKHHGIDHNHLIRDRIKDPHDNQQIKYLVEGKEKTKFTERIFIGKNIHLQLLANQPCQRQKRAGTSKNKNIFHCLLKAKRGNDGNQTLNKNQASNKREPLFLLENDVIS